MLIMFPPRCSRPPQTYGVEISLLRQVIAAADQRLSESCGEPRHACTSVRKLTSSTTNCRKHEFASAQILTFHAILGRAFAQEPKNTANKRQNPSQSQQAPLLVRGHPSDLPGGGCSFKHLTPGARHETFFSEPGSVG